MTHFVKLVDRNGLEVWVNPNLVALVGHDEVGSMVMVGKHTTIEFAEMPDHIVEHLRSNSSDNELRYLVRRLLLVQDTLNHSRASGIAETERLEAEENEVVERLRHIVGMPLPSDLM